MAFHPLVSHVILALSPIGLRGAQQEARPAPGQDVTRAALEGHVRTLAADELEGRLPMTPGIARAADYLARVMKECGVEPAGDDGTFLQKTGWKRFEYPTLPRLLFTDETGATVEAHYGVDFSLKVSGTARSTEKLPLRFFYDYNHSRLPAVGNPAEAVYLSAKKEDRPQILEKHGIKDFRDWGLELGILRDDVGLTPGKAVESMPPRTGQIGGPDGCELVEIRGPLRPAFERRKFTHVQLLVDEVEGPVPDANVVGRIRGVGTKEHPELAQEVVVLCAHYDHLGVRTIPRGKKGRDYLCNGADDNASGCAALLELARALASGPPPARTVVVLFTTGEEKGAVGCHYYLEHPVEPLTKTVAELSLEMLGRPDALAGGAGHLWLSGFERSNLGSAWQERGLAIVPDPRPQQRFYQRLESQPFGLGGVVSVVLSSFAVHREYHTPKDEADTLDYAHLEAATRVALEAARSLADGSLKPAWQPGGQPKPHDPGARPGEDEGAEGNEGDGAEEPPGEEHEGG